MARPNPPYDEMPLSEAVRRHGSAAVVSFVLRSLGLAAASLILYLIAARLLAQRLGSHGLAYKAITFAGAVIVVFALDRRRRSLRLGRAPRP